MLLVLLAALASPALADPWPPMPSAPLDPHSSPSIWNGAYVGTGVTFAATKGRNNQFGGDAFAGIERRFDNNFVIGVRLDTGYSPLPASLGRYRGVDYRVTDRLTFGARARVVSGPDGGF